MTSRMTDLPIPPFKILDSCHSFLSVGYHLTEKIGETGAAELGGPSSIEIPIVDGFAIGRCAELMWRALRRILLWWVCRLRKRFDALL